MLTVKVHFPATNLGFFFTRCDRRIVLIKRSQCSFRAILMKKLKRWRKEFEPDKRMKLQMFILASLALVDCQLGPEYNVGTLTTDTNFLCPPVRDIEPCQCTTIHEIPTVQCIRIRSLKAMKSALSNSFRVKPIPYLKILNSHFVGLPAGAFTNVSVTRLQIEDSLLQYVVADAFLGLENLLLLILQNVQLLTLPSESLRQLSSLVTLSLARNNIIGLADTDLRNSRRLKYLSLVDNRLSHIDRESFPNSLITLALSNNHLISLNRSVRYLIHLEWLFLNNNLIAEIDGEFENLYILRHLKLGRNKLTVLGRAFRNMNNLQILELQYNAILELGDSIRNLSQLKTLNLSMNLLLQLRYSDFEGLTSLRNLYLSGNRLIASNGALYHLSSLQNLDLSHNNFHNFSFSELSTLTQLKVLDLNENRITHISSSSSIRINLVRFLISHNKLTTLSDFMRNLPHLEDIDVSFNKVNILRQADFCVSNWIDYINVQGNPLICDAEQMAVYQQLGNMNIEVDGRPNCTADPPHL